MKSDEILEQVILHLDASGIGKINQFDERYHKGLYLGDADLLSYVYQVLTSPWEEREDNTIPLDHPENWWLPRNRLEEVYQKGSFNHRYPFDDIYHWTDYRRLTYRIDELSITDLKLAINDLKLGMFCWGQRAKLNSLERVLKKRVAAYAQ